MRFGLLMSLVKTETMIMTDEISDKEYPASICVLNGQEIKNVKSFKYLGQKFKCDEANTADCELMTRKMSAITSFYKGSSGSIRTMASTSKRGGKSSTASSGPS